MPPGRYVRSDFLKHFSPWWGVPAHNGKPTKGFLFMEEKTGFGYYVVVPTALLMDTNVSPSAKLCFGVIANLSNQRGYCFASNSYIAELMRVHEMTISKYVSELIKFNYLIKFDEVTASGLQRRLAVSDPSKFDEGGKRKDLGGSAETLRGGKPNDLGGVSENAYHNNIRLITKNNNKENKEDPFDDELSNQAWNDWVKYRKEIRKPLSPSTTESQLNKLRPMAPHTRAGMIRQSIDNGWQGLFEIKTKSKGNGIDYNSELASIYSGLK